MSDEKPTPEIEDDLTPEEELRAVLERCERRHHEVFVPRVRDLQRAGRLS